jgi:aminoglycoside phosphotransferase family enzyme
LRLGDEGVVVDWLVKMTRLPADRMLDRAIGDGRIDETAIGRAAAHLAHFFDNQPPATLSQSEFVQRFAKEIEVQARELARPEFHMPDSFVRSVISAQAKFIEVRPQLLRDRVRSGHVVEGHGDLRPQHICLGEPPAVIDCVEFNRDFRIVDPVEELAFLWMECELLGAPHVGESFWKTYSLIGGDRPPPVLPLFYKCHRACLRAKLSLWHLLDPAVAQSERWRARALQYLQLAESHARNPLLAAT